MIAAVQAAGVSFHSSSDRPLDTQKRNLPEQCHLCAAQSHEPGAEDDRGTRKEFAGHKQRQSLSEAHVLL